MPDKKLTESHELLFAVRAGLVAQGSSLTRWCRENGIKHQNARLSLIGAWNGPKGREVKSRLIAAANRQHEEQDA